MSKLELVQYLVALDQLMRLQREAGVDASGTLSAEYGKHWEMLKKEISDEARKSE